MIPLQKPWATGNELRHIQTAIERQQSGDTRYYIGQCERWLEKQMGSLKAYLTPSCTSALEMAAILLDLQPGDEVIMSSFTFPSMANAFVLRGAVPVFVDIRADNGNIDETLVEGAITHRTKAIVAMHYGGVACEMDALLSTAEKHGLWLIEDAAHAITSTYKTRPLGSIGHLGALSFHHTKNIHCGEGGALLINAASLVDKAEIVRENGTNRAKFLNGSLPCYSWQNVGSSFVASEFSAAFLWAQIEHIDDIQARRMAVWKTYEEQLHTNKSWSEEHNAHLFYVNARSASHRNQMKQQLEAAGISTAPHYQPLHNSAAGKQYGRAAGPMTNTCTIAETLLRLPLWPGLTSSQIEHVCLNVRRQMTPPAAIC